MYALQMFAGNCRDSAGGFLQYLQGKPCNIYRFTEFAGKICIYYRVFPADIAENPRRVPAIPCKHLQCTYILSTYLKSILFLEMFELEIVILMHSGLKQVGKATDLKWAEFYHSPLPVQIGLKVHFVLFCCLKQNRTK